MGKLSIKGVKPIGHLSDDRDHHVYYLPEEHYVGVTSQIEPNRRINKLRGHGFNVDGWKILRTFNTREEARHFENLWHSYLGANGVNLNG